MKSDATGPKVRRSSIPTTIDWKAVAAGKIADPRPPETGPTQFDGKYEIPVPNHENIYLHDTPSKALREGAAEPEQWLRPARGCRALARWLIGQEPVAPSSDPEIRVQLPQACRSI